MKISIRVLTLICATACISLISGCSSLPKFEVSVDSDPQGAVIEVNNEFSGKTPTSFKIDGNGDRTFNGGWVQGGAIEVTATPPAGATNLFKQHKYFQPSAFFQKGDHIPEKIFFDLRQKQEMLNLR